MPLISHDLLETGNHRLEEIEAAGIRHFDEQISSIPNIIKLTLGEPDLNTPSHIKEAAIKSIEENKSHYTPAKGITELRKAAANFLLETQNLRYDPDKEIITTAGSTEGLTASLIALLNPHDEVIVISPAYPLYVEVLKLIGANPVIIDTSDTDFELTPSKLQAVLNEHPKTKGIILNYPNNPTGKEYSKNNLEELAKVIKQNHLLAFSDEIYSELTYNTKHFSIAHYIPERTIIFNGVSKSFAMTGYRIGVIAGPQFLIDKIAKLHSYLITCPTNSSQYAAVEAFNNGQVDIINALNKYKTRRDFLIKELDRIGLNYNSPEGTFYLFIKIPSSYKKNDYQFALDLAHQAHVGVIPGSIFGIGGKGQVRLSYATSLSQLKEAIQRLKKFFETNNS